MAKILCSIHHANKMHEGQQNIQIDFRLNLTSVCTLRIVHNRLMIRHEIEYLLVPGLAFWISFPITA